MLSFQVRGLCCQPESDSACLGVHSTLQFLSDGASRWAYQPWSPVHTYAHFCALGVENCVTRARLKPAEDAQDAPVPSVACVTDCARTTHPFSSRIVRFAVSSSRTPWNEAAECLPINCCRRRIPILPRRLTAPSIDRASLCSFVSRVRVTMSGWLVSHHGFSTWRTWFSPFG